MKKRILSLLVALIMTLSVAVIPVSADDDSFPNATPISLNTEYSGTITDLNTVDYYVFELPESGRISVNLVANIYKTDLYLYDVNRNQIWEHELLTWNAATEQTILNEEIDLTAGTYFFVVKQHSDGGNYHFRLDFTSAVESFPELNGGCNNDFSSASSIQIGNSYRGQIALNDNTDLYKFELSESGSVHVDLSANIYKTNYFLYDEDGNQLWGKENQTWNAAHEYLLDEYVDLTAGTYYFEVQKYLKTGNYEFKLTFGSAKESFPETNGGVNNEAEAASPITVGNTYHGQIALNDTKDFYRFTLAGKEQISLRITAYIYKTSYYLYDSDGNTVWQKELQTSNAQTGELNLEARVELAAGTYFLEVRKYLGTGNYQFTLQKGNPFSDVSEAAYYFNPVMWAISQDPPITSGVDDSHFGPDNSCTREQIVTFLWAANGKPEPEGTGAGFSDVAPGAWYYKPVMWAVENKITSGLPDGSFGVGQPCTRAQAMTFLWASQGKPAPRSMESPFGDVSTGDWFCKAILWAAENGITKGVGDGLFGVNNTCTRAQIITFLYKAFK